MHASYLRQTYFDMPIHEFWCFGIFNSKNTHKSSKNYTKIVLTFYIEI